MTPFLIVGMPRTGSTLLLTGMSQHPEILAFGELMHEVHSERTGPHAIIRDGQKISYADPENQDAIEFLLENVFSREVTGKKAVGFKLFGEHVRSAGTERLFARLKEAIPNLKVIHIVRENYLDIIVSREVAKKTRSWVQYSNARKSETQTTPRVRIEPKDAHRFFENLARTDRFFADFFAGDNYHRVTYASLSRDFVGQMRKVYEFLGVSDFTPSPLIEKQVTSPVRDVLENYGEVRKFFTGTEFERFFTTGSSDLKFVSPKEMQIGEFTFDLDLSADVQKKHSSGKTFVMMKPRNLIELYIKTFDELAPANMFELGIRRGGSMAFYNLAFKPKRHVAIEIDPGPIPPLEQISAWAESEGRRMAPYFGVDQSDGARLAEIVKSEFGDAPRPLDFIVDDASHKFDLSKLSFEALFPRLRTGGVYALEDWGWAHWQGFQGPNAYFAKEPALTNLVFLLVILHTCRPDIIREIRISPGVAFIERGAAELEPATFKIENHLVMRERQLTLI